MLGSIPRPSSVAARLYFGTSLAKVVAHASRRRCRPLHRSSAAVEVESKGDPEVREAAVEVIHQAARRILYPA